MVDRAAMGFALFGISAPVFWLGLMALFLVWKKLGLTGGSGYSPLSDGVGPWLSHMILPVDACSPSSTSRSTRA